MLITDKIIGVFVVYQSLVFTLLFLFFYYKTHNKPYLILAMFMLISSLYFGFGLSYYYADYELLTITYYLSLPVALLFFPVFYLYIVSLTVRNFTFKKIYLLHLIPSISVIILNIPYLNLAFESKLWFVSGGYNQITDNGLLLYLRWINRIGVFVFLNLQLLTYIFISIIYYKKYKLKIENMFSYKENVDLKWIKFLIIFFLVIFLMIDTVHFFNLKTDISQRMFFYFSMLFLNLILFAYGLYQKNIFSKPLLSDEVISYKNFENEPIVKVRETLSELKENKNEIIEDTSIKYLNSSLTNSLKQEIIIKLEEYMTRKPYYYSNLNMDDVAEALETNSKYLSQVINETYQSNFYNYINHFRINDSKHMLLNEAYKNLSTEGIAKTVGFNSKSSFYAAFKKHTGVTPFEYKKNLVV